MVDGLRALNNGTVDLPDDQLARANTFGYFVLGLAHASTAILWDQGYIYNPTIAVEEVSLHPYAEVMTAALGYFDKAIQEASGKTFTIPATWISNDMSAGDLVKLAYSYKAGTGRPWPGIRPSGRGRLGRGHVGLVEGHHRGFPHQRASRLGFSSGTLVNIHRFGPGASFRTRCWAWRISRATTSAGWRVNRSTVTRPADNQVDDPFLIMTPDQRFPSGATIADQQANDGDALRDSDVERRLWRTVEPAGSRFVPLVVLPLRCNDSWLSSSTRADYQEITVAEMDLLAAEPRTGRATSARPRRYQQDADGGGTQRHRRRRHEHELRAEDGERAVWQPSRDAEVGGSPGDDLQGSAHGPVVLPRPRLG